jgi:hypothetical protein
MRSLEQFVNAINDPHLAFALGGIAIAYSDRSRARQKLKEAQSAVDEAKANKEQGARFYINGDHYAYRLDEANALLLQRVDEKRAKEKHFKKLCYEFVELGGKRETLDELLEILVKETA